MHAEEETRMEEPIRLWPALHTYYESVKPFLTEPEAAPALTAQQQLDDLLDIGDVIGKRIISTRLHRGITIREENAITALEVMSRFASNPKWLIYLPPTMSPCETSKRAGLLEHPEEAFACYLHEGVHKVVCEQKHMGSRAIVVVCRDADSARKRFGIMEGGRELATRVQDAGSSPARCWNRDSWSASTTQ